MKHALVLTAAALAAATHVALADVYMHNPRGSNDRACETNDARNNGNRLFNSQNNAEGGYSCGRAWPFACYAQENQAKRDACNLKNWNANDTIDVGLADNDGVLDPMGTRTPRLYFYEGSILQIEWTMQHGCGENPRVHCDIVLQYACEDTLTDNCGLAGGTQKCGPRDGIPVTNADRGPTNADRGRVTYNSVDPTRIGGSNIDRATRDRQATETIPVSTDFNVQADPRFGRHETLAYYLRCFYRERNKGLFIADQGVGERGINTRQQPGGNRHGLECNEERDYWPYWHDSPWKDIAVLTDRVENCQALVAASQNTAEKWECDCPTCIAAGRVVPSSKASCTQAGGTWKVYPAFNIAPPYCGPAPHTRENHLGNSIGGGKSASSYNWTIPSVKDGNTCILRIRYNITSGDPMPGTDRPVTQFGDASSNGANSPIFDRDNSELRTYRTFAEYPAATMPSANLVVQTNTDQFGRTFQDRSHSFSIVKAPVVGECAGKRIFNLNVRGRRGNIVQVYPAVEYDFTPSELVVADTDCIHIQWTGSDYGPAQNANNGFGGPPDPRDLDKGRGDRHNMVQVPWADQHTPVKSLDLNWNMLQLSRERKLYLAFIGQPIEDTYTCIPIEELKTLSKYADDNDDLFQSRDVDGGGSNNYLDNADDRIRYYRNCGTLSGAKTPYFDGGLYRPGYIGSYAYMDSRNNCFTNRRVTGIIHVESSVLAGNNLPLVIVGGVAFIGLAFAGVFFIRRRRQRKAVLEETGMAAAAAANQPGTRGSGGKFAAFLPFGRRGSPATGVVSTPITAPPVPTAPSRAHPQAMPVVGGGAGASGGAGAGAGMGAGGGAKVTALYNHVASEPGELSFKKGDQITVLRKDESGWWEGRGTDGKTGIFPSNYVSA